MVQEMNAVSSPDIKLLIVEDSLSHQFSCNQRIKAVTYAHTVVSSLAQAQNTLIKQRFDLVVLDYKHTIQEAAREFIELLKTINCPWIIAIESGQEDIAIQAIEEGAQDYIIKDDQGNYFKLLPSKVKQVINHHETARQLELLRVNEPLIKVILESSVIGLVVINAKGNFIRTNSYYEDLLGYSKSELESMNCLDVTLKEDWAENLRLFRELVSGKTKAFTIEKRYIHRQGHLVWVEITAHQLGDAGLFVALVKNITDHKQTEQALRDSQAELNKLVNSMEDDVFVLSREGEYLKILSNGPAIANTINRKLEQDFDKEKADRFKEIIAKVLNTQESFQHEYYTLIEGEETWFDTIVSPLDNDSVLWEARNITKLKMAENALKELNQELESKVEQRTADFMEIQRRYQLLFNSKVDAVLVQEFVGNGFSQKFSEVNDVACQRLEYTREELLELSPSQITANRSVPHQEISKRLKTKNQAIFESQQITKTGKILPVEINLNQSIHQGKTVILTFVRDISSRKQAEEALLESQQFLQTVLDAFPLYVFWKDCNSVYLGCNLKFALSAGLSSTAEIVGKTDYDLPWSADETKSYLTDDCQVIESNQAKLGIIETQVQLDNSLLWVETNKIPLNNTKGEVIGVLGTYRDITAEKAAVELIREQAEKEALILEITQRIRQSLDLNTIFDTACSEVRQFIQADRVSILQFDPDSEFKEGLFVWESVIEGYTSIKNFQLGDYHYTQEAIDSYQKGHAKVVNDCSFDGLAEAALYVAKKFQISSYLSIPLLNGDNLWGLLCINQCSSTRIWQDEEIEFVKQIGNQFTIAIQQAYIFEQLQKELSERKLTEAKLTQSNQQLAHATRLKDEFLANMSHELRTPLNAILGMTEALEEGAFENLNDKQTKAIQTIKSGGKHLLDLIEDILDLARIETGEVKLNLTQTSIKQLCQSSLIFVKQQALQKNIQLKVIISSDLPCLIVDERHIRQVLINLLNNAVKFTPLQGEISLEVTKKPDCMVEIAIKDTGIGIAPEDLEKIFQPFIQVDSALNRQYRGTGLGLALVKKIVEMHDGQIKVTSKIGEGSCFTVSLPYDESASLIQNREDCSQTRSVDELTNTNAQLPVVLLAEDNEANIMTISSYLKAKGYRIILARNGLEAIEKSKRERPDIVLMDIQMPEIDGLQAIKEIRRQTELENMPIIALTALVMQGDREKCLQSGASEYMTKPVKLSQLTMKIHQLLLTEAHLS